MPSLHLAYAVIAGVCLYRWGGNRLVRAIGLAYPLFVAVEVVATGNHFFLDLVAAVAVDACALAIASRLLSGSSGRRVIPGVIASPSLARSCARR